VKAENIIACGVVIIMGISSALMLAAEFNHKLMEAMQDCQRRHMQVVVRGPVVECFTRPTMDSYLKMIIKIAREDEREACARVCADRAADDCAVVIRLRGEK